MPPETPETPPNEISRVTIRYFDNDTVLVEGIPLSLGMALHILFGAIQAVSERFVQEALKGNIEGGTQDQQIKKPKILRPKLWMPGLKGSA